MKCPICDNKQLIFLFPAKDYISGDVFSVSKCRNCDGGLTEPVSDSGGLKKYYPESYYGSRKSFFEDAVNRWRIKKLPGRIQKFSVLDIGCGNGSFLKLLSRRGFLVRGTEIAPEYHFSNTEISSKICKKELKECKFSDNEFDIITMWHTLEHFANPLDYLSETRRILKENGFLIIEVPNFQSWQSRLTKSNWFHLDVPRHVFHYSPQSMNIILSKTGFKILKISTDSFVYGFFGWVQSCLNVFCQRKNLLFDFLNKKAEWKDFRDAAITFFLVVPVSLLALPFFLLEIIFKKGATLTVWAQTEYEKNINC